MIQEHEARFWSFDASTNLVVCFLCRRRCKIPEGGTGFCGVRKRKNNILYSLVYGRPVSYAVDAIEKKPFFHFYPGSLVFSLATVGCNFRCTHCQNADISQSRTIRGAYKSPSDIVNVALRTHSHGIAYTYTEPTIFMEYALDISAEAKKHHLFNVFVTNGYLTPEAIEATKGLIDASRIDLKAFNERFYREVCGSVELDGVLDSIKLLYRTQKHIEIITLLIPGYNDSEDEIRSLAQWVADLDKNIPLHFTAYYPAHKMRAPPTSSDTLHDARTIALDYLHYVYTGNVLGDKGENTYCHNCGELLIERYGFSVQRFRIEKDKCPACGTTIPGVWSLSPF